MNFIDGIHSFVATNGINFVFSAICALIFVLIGFKEALWKETLA